MSKLVTYIILYVVTLNFFFTVSVRIASNVRFRRAAVNSKPRGAISRRKKFKG